MNIAEYEASLDKKYEEYRAKQNGAGLRVSFKIKIQYDGSNQDLVLKTSDLIRSGDVVIIQGDFKTTTRGKIYFFHIKIFCSMEVYRIVLSLPYIHASDWS